MMNNVIPIRRKEEPQKSPLMMSAPFIARLMGASMLAALFCLWPLVLLNDPPEREDR
jgi:hypothetical protein